MTRLTAQELAEMELNVCIYPHIGVLEHVARLREAYAEIDRLNSVATELQRDMDGTLATLEGERRKGAAAPELLEALTNLWGVCEANGYEVPMGYRNQVFEAIAKATGRAARKVPSEPLG